MSLDALGLIETRGLIGSIEALEAIKLIIGAGSPLIGKMVYFDTLSDKEHPLLMEPWSMPDPLHSIRSRQSAPRCT